MLAAAVLNPSHLFQHLGYAAILVIVLLGNAGVPAPEESVLVLGGYHSFGANGFRRTPLAGALPVVFADAAEPQVEKPFGLELTEKGKAHAMFAVHSDRVQNEKLWKEAAPLEGMPLVARAKPGADVLAVNPIVEVSGEKAVALAVQHHLASAPG